MELVNAEAKSDHLSKSRSPKCANCRNHGVLSLKKNHKRFCQWADCKCKACTLTDERRRVMREQTRQRRRMIQDEQFIVPLTEDVISLNSSTGNIIGELTPLQKLIRMFPLENASILNTLLQQCHGDLQQCVARLLENRENLQVDVGNPPPPPPLVQMPSQDMNGSQRHWYTPPVHTYHRVAFTPTPPVSLCTPSHPMMTVPQFEPISSPYSQEPPMQ